MVFHRLTCLGLLFLSTFAAASVLGEESSLHISRRGLLTDNLLTERDFVAPDSLLNRRDVRGEAAKRVLIAKKRAARKAKRDAATKEAELAKRKAFTGVASTSAFATYLGTKCSRDKYCVNAEVKAALPTNGVAVCNLSTRFCTISCAANFILQDDGSCLESAASCPTLQHGIYTVVNGVCTPQCKTNLGYALSTSASGVPSCVNIATSTTHCGSLTAAPCPKSYNGLGKRQCTNGVCNLRCPVSLFLYYTTTGKPFCA